jgi:hypothetical protein
MADIKKVTLYKLMILHLPFSRRVRTTELRNRARLKGDRDPGLREVRTADFTWQEQWACQWQCGTGLSAEADVY